MSLQENSDSLASFDECSNENNNAEIIADVSCSSDKNLSKELNENEESNQQIPIDSAIRNSPVESTESDVDLYSTSRKISKKWIGEFDVAPNTPSTIPTPNVYDFQNNRRESVEEKIQLPSHNQHSLDDTKLGLSMYRRTESSNASLLVEAALDAAEREIGAVSSPILEDSDREANLYSIPNELDFKAACSQSQMVHKSPNGHLNSYMQDELVTSPAGTPHARHTPPSHIHLDYHLHRPVDYINATSRTHNIEQYLDQQDLQRVIHVSQESSTSPSRYQEIPHPHSHPQTHHLSLSHTHPHHHQVANEAISSDEGDSVAQNLSLPMKEKSLQQLEFSKYDGIDNDFSLVNRERVRFESLIVPSAADQGLDMSARGFQQTFGSQVQNSPHHHHHHLYEMNERERQGVDLSRTSACMSPPAYSSPYAPYSHVDVPRVVNLESASRSHHLHTSVSRIITSPQPASSLTSHLVPESLETRILSPPPPSMPTYNATYSVGPSPYHTSRTGYHYSGYY